MQSNLFFEKLSRVVVVLLVVNGFLWPIGYAYQNETTKVALAEARAVAVAQGQQRAAQVQAANEALTRAFEFVKQTQPEQAENFAQVVGLKLAPPGTEKGG